MPVAGVEANYMQAMKNADDMLDHIMDAVDQNGDGKIQFEGTVTLNLMHARQLPTMHKG